MPTNINGQAVNSFQDMRSLLIKTTEEDGFPKLLSPVTLEMNEEDIEFYHQVHKRAHELNDSPYLALRASLYENALASLLWDDLNQ